MSKQSTIQQIASKIISLISNHNSDSSAHQSLFNTKLNVSDAFSGDYEDLDNKPSIPTNISDLNDDSEFLTSQDITGKEDKSNKVTILSALSTDIQYPSAKIVYNSLSNKEDKSKKVTTLSTNSTNDEYPSAKAVYDAIHTIPSPEFVEITSNKGTASASTMKKFYVEVGNNKRDVYYTEESNGSYSWHKLDTDILDDLSIDWEDIQNKPSTMTPTSHTDSNGAYGKATTSVWGHTKLNSATNSTDETTAATPKAVNIAYNLANSKANTSDIPTTTNELTYNGLSTTTIPSGGLSSKTDLNNDVYWDEGRYICHSNNAGSLLSSSLPQTSTGFILDVLNHSQGKIQIFTTINTGNPNIYYKIKNTTGTSETSWVQVAKVSDIPKVITNTSGWSSSLSDSKVPSEKLVKNSLDNKANSSDLSNYIQKSNTSGLVKNDGSIDTNSYAKTSQIPDISGKANSADLATVATTGSYNDLSNKPAPTTIASGTNLNTCIEAGEYICNTTTIAKTLTHTPWGDSTSTNAVAFNMQVYKTGQASGKVMISQIIHDYNGNNTYTRTCYANTASNAYLTTGWSTWEVVVKSTKQTVTVTYIDGTTETINFLTE